MKTDLLKFMNTLNMEDLPEEYKSEETSRLEYKILCLKRELLKGDMTKEEIKLTYGVDDYVIDTIADKTYAKSYEAGEYVAKKFRMLRDITREEDVNAIVGEINNCGNIKNVKLSLEQRIMFANNMYKYSLVDTFKETVMDNLYTRLPEKSPEAQLISFANKEFGVKTKKFRHYGVHDADVDFSWLDLFNIDYYFGVRNGKQNNRYKFKVNGKEKELSIERAIEVMKILRDNNIPLADCIVKTALRKDLFNELDEFILSLVGDKKVRARKR